MPTALARASKAMEKAEIAEQKAAAALEAAQGSAASQPSAAVWVCQLGSPDGKEPETIGSAFNITASVSDVDDLKEAIEKKEKLTIAASKINIHHQEDGR
ncbi:unnamed protein product [Effrenium voratum]|uniref:Uncharacterized protein n=1 Tax=Effrenium voratum TaxID=2562239 RepID=A0AA36IAX4_9DINO|nr:unnamed protein product [Effrenium voratum]CAJ1415665.1 unnamed protein product [Effrenium voratum]